MHQFMEPAEGRSAGSTAMRSRNVRDRRPVDASQAMELQRRFGNHAAQDAIQNRLRSLGTETDTGPSTIERPDRGYKTWGSAGGLEGINLDITFSVTDTPTTSLQAIQTVMTTRGTDGAQVGTYSWTYKGKTWDAFVDGGKNSPYVTMSGNPPAHPTMPYYLTPAEVIGLVSFTKDHGTIQITDRVGAAAIHDEAYLETAIVAVNHKGEGKDKFLRAFKWGWTGFGTKAEFGKGTKIAGKASGVQVINAPSPEFKNIVKHDYPTYSLS
jgi:hypothetical protein